MANPPPLVSPWVWETYDTPGRVLRVTVSFNNTTHAITGITSHRDSGCAFTQLLIGIPAIGAPNDTDKVLDIPDGTTVVGAGRLAALASRGLNSIDDILTLQITAA